MLPIILTPTIDKNKDNCGAILLVDFKLMKNNEMRVVELGCGTNSTFTGYDCFFEDPADHLRLKTLANLASEFDYVSCENAGLQGNSPHFGYIPRNIYLLREKKGITNITVETARSESSKGAVIHYATESKDAFKNGVSEKSRQKEGNRQNYPILMNGSCPIFLLAEDKVMYSKFAKESQCKLKPQDQLMHFDLCTETQIEQSINRFPCYPAVIKATNAAGGMGALIVKDKDHAKLLLLAIRNKSDNLDRLALSSAEKEAMVFWQKRTEKTDRFFLLQEYVAGKQLVIDHQPYQPTGRLVFYVYYVNNERHFKIIDGYWKLPRAPENEQLSVETTISHITETDGQIFNSCLIDAETMDLIKGQFEQEIAPLLDYTFSLDGKEILLNMLESSDYLEREYAISELPKLIGSFYDLSQHLNKANVPEYLLNVLRNNEILAEHCEKSDFIFYQLFSCYQSLNQPQKEILLDMIWRKCHFFDIYSCISVSTRSFPVFLREHAPNFSQSKLAGYLQKADTEKEFIDACIQSKKAICAASADYLYRNTRIGHEKYQNAADSIMSGLKIFGTFGGYCIKRSINYDRRVEEAISYSKEVIYKLNTEKSDKSLSKIKEHIAYQEYCYLKNGTPSNIEDVLVLYYLLNDGQGGNSLGSFNYLLTSHFFCRTAESDAAAEKMVGELKIKLQGHLGLTQELAQEQKIQFTTIFKA